MPLKELKSSSGLQFGFSHYCTTTVKYSDTSLEQSSRDNQKNQTVVHGPRLACLIQFVGQLTEGGKLMTKKKSAFNVILGMAMLLGVWETAGAVTYTDGVSPLLSSAPAGTFDLGTHLPSYIGGTTQEGVNAGSLLDGVRVYFFDATGSTDNPATATPFNLLVWQFGAAKDSVRLYTHQDHYAGGPISDPFVAQDVMEYSVWGCNGLVGACKTQGEWSLLSDVTAFDINGGGAGKPTYTFAGTEPTTVYRGGSAEFGVLNAYARDYTFGTSYNYFGIRASTISMIANDADPELDALVAFNRVDFPPPGGSVPEPGTVLLLGTGLAGLAVWRKMKQS
jgi:hypothetical protein